MTQFMRTTSERTQHGVTCKCCKDYGLPDEMTFGHTPMTLPHQTAVDSVILAGYKLSREITGSTRCPVLMTTCCPNRNCFNHGTVRFPTLGHTKSHCPCDWRKAPNVSKLGEHMLQDLIGDTACTGGEGFENIDTEELAIEQMIELDEESRMAESIDEYYRLLKDEEDEELEWQATFHSHIHIRESPKLVEVIPPPPPVEIEVIPPPPPVEIEVIPPPPPVEIEVIPPPPPVEIEVGLWEEESNGREFGHFQDSSGAIHICKKVNTNMDDNFFKVEMGNNNGHIFADDETLRIRVGNRSVEEFVDKETVIKGVDSHTIHIENASLYMDRVIAEHSFEIAKFEQNKKDSRHFENKLVRNATKKRLKELSKELGLLERQLDWDKEYGYSPEEDEYNFLRRHGEISGKYSQRCSFIECEKKCVHEIKHGEGSCNRLHIPLRPSVV